MRLFAICAVLVSSLIGFGATAAEAAIPLCGQVWAEGDLILPTTEGNCPDPRNPVTGGACVWRDYGLDPAIHVAAYACVPDPLTAP
jgi:hypothetical protein